MNKDIKKIEKLVRDMYLRRGFIKGKGDWTFTVNLELGYYNKRMKIVFFQKVKMKDEVREEIIYDEAYGDIETLVEETIKHFENKLKGDTNE